MPKRTPRAIVLSVVGVCCLLLSGLGGFGSFRSFVEGTQQVVAAGAAFTLSDSVVGGDPGGTSVSEAVVGMIPGDFRERLVTLTPNSDFRPGIGISVAGSLASDLTPSSIAGVSQGGDALNILEGSNSGSLTGLAAAGQGGLFIEVWSCVGTWSSVDGVVGASTADRDYSCSAGGDGTRITAYDVPTTGESYTRWIVSPLTGPTTLLLRTRLTDDGTTNGRQNTLGAETVNLTHRFTAATYREQNDLFNNATPIVEPAEGQSSPTFNVGGLARNTVEPGEVVPSAQLPRSAWFRYRPTVTQTVNLNIASDGSEGLGHWIGTSINGGSLGQSRWSGVSAYTLTGGVEYFIRLAGSAIGTPMTSSSFRLSRSLDTTNDMFGNATVVSELAEGTQSTTFNLGSLSNYSVQPGEISPIAQLPRSAWFQYTTTTNQTMNVVLASDGSEGLAHWIGTSINGGAISESRWDGTQPLNLSAGLTYYFRFAPSAIGTTLTYSSVQFRRALDSTNDIFANAVTVAELSPGGSTGLVSVGSLANATSEPSEVGVFDQRPQSIWYRYTPSSSYTVNLTTSSSAGALGHWVGTSINGGQVSAWYANGTYPLSLSAGVTYFFRLAPQGSIGNLAGGQFSLSRP